MRLRSLLRFVDVLKLLHIVSVVSVFVVAVICVVTTAVLWLFKMATEFVFVQEKRTRKEKLSFALFTLAV